MVCDVSISYLSCYDMYTENQFLAVHMMLRNDSVYNFTCGFNIYFLFLMCLNFICCTYTDIAMKNYKENILPLHPNKKHFSFPGSSLHLVHNKY